MNLHIKDVVGSVPTGTVVAQREEMGIADPLANLVGRSAASKLLRWAGSAGLRHMAAPEMAAVAGVSERVAERVVAARGVFDTLTRLTAPRLQSFETVVAHLPPGLALLEHEVLLGAALSSSLELRAMLLLARGGASHASVTPRDVFVPVIRSGASALVLVHNHPSGDATPSPEDVHLTNTVTRAGALLGIRVLDHLIVAGSRVESLLDLGLMLTEDELQKEAANA